MPNQITPDREQAATTPKPRVACPSANGATTTPPTSGGNPGERDILGVRRATRHN